MTINKGIKPNDKRIAHLDNLGITREKAIEKLMEKMKEDPGFLEFAEITDSHKFRDGGLIHTELSYVAGICGSRESKTEGDLGDDVYRLLYFNSKQKNEEGNWEPEETIYSNSLGSIVDYRPVILK